MNSQLGVPYKSASQRARVITETWGEHNLFCPNCTSPQLTRLEHNAKAYDFTCPRCSFSYQLKGQQTRITNSIPDGAYGTMMEAVQNGKTPNFFFMHYDIDTWTIRNLLLIPHFALPISAVIKRKPLSVTARRAGWIGCNISLSNIPVEARIEVVKENIAAPEEEVRTRFERVKPLGQVPVNERGWTLDVLTSIQGLGKNEFTNEDAYTLVPHLERLHPGNRHVRDKIRQRLQVLRDMGFLIHVERGRWRLC